MSKRNFNLPLWLGLGLASLFVFIAIFGPVIAPHNPMTQNYAIEIDGSIVRPPIAPLRHPDYLIGTDNQGRDLLSRILWGVRPTLIMVGIAAFIRLTLGMLAGLFIGWNDNRTGKLFENILTTALSVPGLIVALIGITAAGIENGLPAFIFGMAINGWAESARVVADQTRILKRQTFVEAAQGLGASNQRIMFSHIFNHILPLAGMMAAFEISAVLLLSAELGFLGYYVGGGIYVEVSDFVTENVTGLPELGQMLATSLLKLTDPSVLLTTGLIILMAVLGFNLMGEGLRREMSQERLRGSWMEKFFGQQTEEWIEKHITMPFMTWWDKYQRLAWVGIAVASIGVAAIWWVNQPRASQVVVTNIEVPGGHLWASERHDAQGTRHAEVDGVHNPRIAWVFPAPGSLSGGPAVAADGTIYIAGRAGQLVALTPEGEQKWVADLPEIPVGGPALGADNSIYQPGELGGLMAYAPDGSLLWYVPSEVGRPATSGAIVDSGGNIYYTVIDRIYAFSPDGELLWKTGKVSTYMERPPVLSPDGSLIFLERNIYSTTNGAQLGIAPELDPLQYPDQFVFTGADGKMYFRVGHESIRWSLDGNVVGFEEAQTWQNASTGFVPYFPTDQGASPDGSVWFFYASQYTDTRLVWLDPQGRTLNNVPLSQTAHQVIGLDRQSTVYSCNYAVCLSMPQTNQEPGWTIALDAAGLVRLYQGRIVGGALLEDRLYVAAEDALFAIVSGDK